MHCAGSCSEAVGKRRIVWVCRAVDAGVGFYLIRSAAAIAFVQPRLLLLCRSLAFLFAVCESADQRDVGLRSMYATRTSNKGSGGDVCLVCWRSWLSVLGSASDAGVRFRCFQGELSQASLCFRFFFLSFFWLLCCVMSRNRTLIDPLKTPLASARLEPLGP